MSSRGLSAVGLGAAAVFLARGAGAYSIESAITDGCHESISVGALRELRADAGLAPPLVPDRDDRALIDDLPFTLDDDVRDLAAASFLVGIRDNDLKGRGAMEVDQLAFVHGNPGAQREHCLRSRDDDEPDGAASALDDCKAFIRDGFAAALGGLDASGLPDPTRLAEIQVHLELRGKVTAKLPLFWVTIGQALHAVLRTTLNAGVSVSLTSLYGVPSGAVGVYGALTPLGLEWKVSQRLYVVFDALGVAVPIPQLRGVPFAYPQYRTALGLEAAL